MNQFEHANSFHQDILSWDPTTLEGKPIPDSAVPSLFESGEIYKTTFLQLLFTEVKAQIQNFVETKGTEKERTFDIRFLKLYSRKSDDIFRYCNIQVSRRANLKHLDLIRISKKTSSETISFLGIVSYTNPPEIKILKEKEKEVDLVALWEIEKIGNLIQSTRQHTALYRFNENNFQFPLKNFILNPKNFKCSAVENWQLNLSNSYLKNLNSVLNPSQCYAVRKALSLKDGFCLVQGPPGTGKTFTSIKILNSLHLQQKMKFYSEFSNLSNYKGLFVEKEKEIEKPKPSPSSTPDLFDEILAGISSLKMSSGSIPENTKATWNPRTISRPPKILVCASSNAAVDEILQRVVGKGFLDNSEKLYKPFVVRMGQPKTENKISKPVCIEYIISQYLENKEKGILNEVERRKQEITMKMNETLDILSKKPWKPEIGAQFGKLKRDLDSTTRKIERLKLVSEYQKSIDSYPRDEIFDKQKNQLLQNVTKELTKLIINDAEIVFATLTGAGMNNLTSFEFDVVFLDEAAQSVELETIIALQHKCSRCIMVGDPMQLPATVISEKAKDLNFEQSLFQRLQPFHPPILLNVQYRMHPQISLFPNTHFYNSKLENGSNTKEMNHSFYSTDYFTPLRFFDLEESQEIKETNSFQNQVEADFILELYNKFLALKLSQTYSIGIITPYSKQLQLLQNIFKEFNEVEINTIDGFQGREKDIIIISCVRTLHNRLGFLTDIRRLNVAITRPKACLWIVGNSKKLNSNETWKALIDFTIQQKSYTKISKKTKKVAQDPFEDVTKLFSNLSVKS